jgi:hypothetical protein
MTAESIFYKPLKGQTFSLFAVNDHTDQYFQTIKSLTSNLLKEYKSEATLLKEVRELSRNKQKLFRLFNTTSQKSELLKLLYSNLHQYTTGVKEHLRQLSVFKSFDKTLNTSEYQYHLQMVEVELVNRIYVDEFRKASFKFALLPHCLRDFTRQCKAEMGDLDYVCKSCSKDCFVKHASDALKKYNIKPYIWMNMNLKKLAVEIKAGKEKPGVLGIACFPELVNGMRMCIKAGIPVVGIPLNANRCARWTGSFLENSVNIKELECLVG